MLIVTCSAYNTLQKVGLSADYFSMSRHLHLVPAGEDLAADDVTSSAGPKTNVIDLDTERRRRRYRYHPSAGRAWLDDLFDEEFDPLDPIA